MSLTQLVLTLVMGIAALWCVRELAAKNRYDPAGIFGWLSAAFTGLALGNVLSVPAVSAAIDQAIGVGSGRVVFNALTTAGLCALVCCFRLGAGVRLPPAAARSAIVREWLMWAAVVLVLTAASWGRVFSLKSLAGPAVSASAAEVFYVVGNGYFIYAYGFAAVALARLLRGGDGAATYRVGFAVAAASLTLLCGTCLVRVLWVLSPSVRAIEGGVVNEVNFAAANTATLGICIGMCVPALWQLVTVARVRRLRQQQDRMIEPLWQSLTTTFPELVLDTGDQTPAGKAGLFRSRSPGPHRSQIEWKLYRRYVECRDGLTRLSPFLADVAGEDDVEELTPSQIAALIDAAQRRYATAAPATFRTARRILTADPDTDFEYDLGVILEVAQALPAR
ncbi:hypothetical protein TPB0596_10180 [Tsukamurella pulmonis]|uniref:MAB_1171c family putative transporter n=1 Tax=Tsukamurella pulmonis TaxID=47312 RepID=UPI001EDF8FB4|nr:MAB_1171c family putative transporter [Tsukamurella pulmonis]BDD81255.1 hypothetical protein TPB0596_10180 [Tsukamurella pulmonis]